MLAALGVLLVLAGALAGTLLVLNTGDRVSVVAVTERVPAGSKVPTSAIKEVRVASDSSVNYVSWDQRRQLTRLRTRTSLVPGTLVIGQMLTKKAAGTKGKVVVGLSLKDGQYPDGLKSGDRVRAFKVGSNGGGDQDSSASGSSGASGSGGGQDDMPLAGKAVVYSAPSSDGSGGVSTGTRSVSVLVSQDQAASLSKAAADGKVALVLLPPGSGS